MKLCLVDRIAIIWGVVLIMGIVALQQPGGFAVSIQADNIIDGWCMLLLKVVLLPWFILRVLDFILGGPSRRSYRIN